MLSPGADLLSMIMMTVPLLFLYEVGVAGSAIVHRRRAKAAAIAALVLLALGVGATPGLAQEPVRAGRPTADSLRGRIPSRPASTGEGDQDSRPGQSLDSATARRLGLPTAPSRSFAQPDSVVNELLNRQGYRPTGTAPTRRRCSWRDQEVRLQGQALTERQGAMLEADSITYRRDSCLLAPRASRTSSTRGRCWWAKGSAMTPAAGEG